jgi:hypothetical protein
MEPNRAVDTSSRVESLIIVVGLKMILSAIGHFTDKYFFSSREGTYVFCENEME